MRLVIVSENNTDQGVQTFEDVIMIEFENQEYLDNGMWIHVFKKDEVFSVSFDPKTEWFNIMK